LTNNMEMAGFEHHWVGSPAGLLSAWRSAKQLPACLMISPFAEEQSRCRRLQFDISANLAAQGLNSCWLDLPGTGDSPVDETDISAEMWLACVTAAAQWCNAESRTLVMAGGLRLGGAVAIRWRQTQSLLPLIFAVEPISGSYALRALLRSRIAQDGTSSEQLLLRLQADQTIEAAGYPLSLATKKTLDQFPMAETATPDVTVIRSTLSDMPPWLQMESQPAPELASHLARQIASLLPVLPE
jgi:esterase/lipase